MKAITSLKYGIVAATLCSAALTANSKVYRHVTADSEGIVLKADSIDYRSDLTRLYGRLSGMPHTSHRIDSVSIKVDGRGYAATDIDGVDLKRWFQWEEDGEIPVEIDFPKLTVGKKANVEAVTPRGVSIWILNIE